MTASSRRLDLVMLVAATLASAPPLWAQGSTGYFPFEPGVTVGTANQAGGARLADVNDDGHVDVVCITKNGLNGQVTTLLGQGNGLFTTIAGASTTEQARVQAVADLTGDGVLDILQGSHDAYLQVGAGDGSFGPLVHLDDGQFMRAADLDGDGDGDAIVGDNPFFPGFPIGLVVRLQLNDGSGAFSLAQTLPAGDHYLRDLEAADLDGDGKANVLALLDDGSVLHWDDDGSGTWSAAAAPVFPAVLRDLEIVDLDQDGALDLVGVSMLDVHSLRGLGDGTFAAPVTRALAAAADAVRCGDLDGDGLPDLAVSQTSGFLDAEVELLHGAGDGSFDADTHLWPGFAVGFALIADVNEDGVADVFAARHPSSLLVFRQRQYAGTPWSDVGGAVKGGAGWPILLAKGPLTPGSQVQLDLHLAAGPAYLVLGVSALGLPFKGGTLHPAPDFVIGGLVPSDAGSLHLASTWPAIAGGFPLVAQVWIPDASGPQGYATTGGVRGEVP